MGRASLWAGLGTSAVGTGIQLVVPTTWAHPVGFWLVVAGLAMLVVAGFFYLVEQQVKIRLAKAQPVDTIATTPQILANPTVSPTISPIISPTFNIGDTGKTTATSRSFRDRLEILTRIDVTLVNYAQEGKRLLEDWNRFAEKHPNPLHNPQYDEARQFAIDSPNWRTKVRDKMGVWSPGEATQFASVVGSEKEKLARSISRLDSAVERIQLERLSLAALSPADDPALRLLAQAQLEREARENDPLGLPKGEP
jgi:hypothetical protein